MPTPTPFFILSSVAPTEANQDKYKENKQSYSKGDLIKQRKFLVRINLALAISGYPSVVSHYVAAWFYFLFCRSQAIWKIQLFMHTPASFCLWTRLLATMFSFYKVPQVFAMPTGPKDWEDDALWREAFIALLHGFLAEYGDIVGVGFMGAVDVVPAYLATHCEWFFSLVLLVFFVGVERLGFEIDVGTGRLWGLYTLHVEGYYFGFPHT